MLKFFLEFSFPSILSPCFLLCAVGCNFSSGGQSFDQFSSNSTRIPSGSIIVSSNLNATTGPGLITVWTSEGELDRVIYDYSKLGTGYASGMAFVAPTKIFAVSDTGGSATNDFLDLFNYETPFANPFNLFSTLTSGAAATYMRQTAIIEDLVSGRYLAFVSESGSNRVARLTSPIVARDADLNFTRDYNFAANGTCTLATPYGVSHIPTSGNIAVVASAASGRVNVFTRAGTCVGSAAATNFPTGSAYHALSDKILVTYATNSSIVAHSVTTGSASPATAIYTNATQLSTPRAIASDSAGYIYVGSDGLDQVIKLYWDGVSASAVYVGTIIQSSIFTQNITAIEVVP